MHLRAVLLGTFLFLATSYVATADDWLIAPEKGTLVPDKAFSDQVTAQLQSRGLDWGPWMALTAVENPNAVPTAGKHYLSPDKKFTAQVIIEDRECYIVIQNTQTSHVSRINSDTFPIFAIAWSPDSKTILAVVHSPMTSYIKIIHRDGSDWKLFDIGAPHGADDDRFHVVGWQFKTDYIEATYIVDRIPDNDDSLKLSRCTFHVSTIDGRTSDVHKEPISQEDFILLRNSSN